LGLDLPELRYHLAFGYYRLGKLDLAAEQCQAALRLDPGNSLSHNLLGLILATQGKLDEAISHLKSAAELDPTYADPHGNMAIAYLSKGDYAAAWREVHLCVSIGGQPNPRLISALSTRMPDPGR